MYCSTVGRTQPAGWAAASAIAHWLFCRTPWTSFSHRRTAVWASGSMPEVATRATHSSSERPVRAAIESATALIIWSGEATPNRDPDPPRAPARASTDHEGGDSVRWEECPGGGAAAHRTTFSAAPRGWG